MKNTPYVHNYTDELEAMPILARGSNAAVFHTIGLILPSQPEGASEDDIAKYTALSIATVRTTLANLLHSGLIIQANGKYTAAKYIEFRKPNITVSGKTTQKSFLHKEDSSIYQSFNQSNQTNKVNFYAEYESVFHELASDRSAQAIESVEKIEKYPAEWVREAFMRTAQRELQDVQSGGEVWRQFRRVPYALRVLSSWKIAGQIDPPTTYPTRQERVKREKDTPALEVEL